MMKNILVIGGGSWGTCLSKLLVENKNNVFCSPLTSCQWTALYI